MTQLLNVQEAMRRLGIKRTKLYDEFGSGKLQSVQIGTRRFVLESELDRYIAELPTNFRRAKTCSAPTSASTGVKEA